MAHIHNRQGAPFTPEEEDAIRHWKEQGVLRSEIARRLGRKPHAISHKWHYMKKDKTK